MDAGFQDDLASWGPFYGFVGTAAVTLLGLLFVAVSLRLNIFRDARIADVRDFARLTLFSFLAPMVMTGLTLMPHEHPVMLAIPLFTLSAVGVLASISIAREWRRLNPASARDASGFKPWQWQGWVVVALVGLAYVALAVVAALFLLGSDVAFAFLAVVVGWMLLTGTMSAWVMLTNAGAAAGQ